MKTKDFFRLVIKLLGLYLLVIYVFQSLPNTVLPYFYLFNEGNNEWMLSIWPTIMTLLLVALFFFLTFNPDFFIEKLKLDKGFDSDVIGLQNLNEKSILNVGIILIGGLIFIENLAPFLNSSFFFIKSKVATSEELRLQSNLDTQSYVRLGINILNMIIGYVLLSNYQPLSTFLLPKKESPDKEN
jgi:hypothetical protein